MNFVLVLAWLLALGQTIKCFIKGYDSNKLDTIYSLVLLLLATIPCVVNLVLFLMEDICHMKEVKLNLIRFFLMDYYKVWNYRACESGKQIYCNQAFNEPKVLSLADYVILSHDKSSPLFDEELDFEMNYCKLFGEPISVFGGFGSALVGMPWIMQSLLATPNPTRLVTLAIKSGNIELGFAGDQGVVVVEKVPLKNMNGVSAEDKLSRWRKLLLIATDNIEENVFEIGKIFVHVWPASEKIMIKHVDNTEKLGCVIDFKLDRNKLCTLMCLLSYWKEYPERGIWSDRFKSSWFRKSGAQVVHALTVLKR